MRFLIFADLHANIFALQNVLKQSKNLNIDKILSLGDLVGYNSYPNECLNLSRENKIDSVKGNHEALVTQELSMDTCHSERSQNAIEITRGLLSADNLDYIRRLPGHLNLQKGICLQHAGFHSIHKTLNRIQRVIPEFKEMAAQQLSVVFFGHTHRPGMFFADEKLQNIRYDDSLAGFAIKPSGYFMINPGSAGEPRHGLPAGFLVFDSDSAKVEFRMVELSDSEKKELINNNRKVFGVTNLKRLPRQIKEKSKKVYYKVGQFKDTILRREN